MTQGIAHRIASATAAIALLVFAGCKDSVGPDEDPIDPVPVASVSVTPPTKSLLLGEQVTLQATPKAADGEELERTVTWASENESLATVSETGVVTTLAVGEVGITAVSEGRTGRSVLTVLPLPPVDEVRLSVDDEIVLEWNGSAQISAVALDADGNVLRDRVVEWMSNRPNIVTVTDGLIQAIDDGLATVTAVIEGVPASVGVRVNMAPVTDVFIDKESDGLEVGQVAVLGSRVRRASGEEFYVPVTWTSSDPSLVTIVPDLWYASVEVLREGVVTITASREGKSSSFTFRITPRVTHDLIYNRWTATATESEIFLLELAVDGNNPLRLNAGNVSREPSPSPDGTEFVFAVSQRTLLREYQHDLFIVNRNGMNMRWLTRAPEREDTPKWSPDGNWILFHGVMAGRHDLFLIHKNGSGLTNITARMPEAMTAKHHPAWAPDGTRIAFIGVMDSQHKVWTIGVDGMNVVQVTTDEGLDMSPTWSPTGDRIAFVRHNTANSAHGADVMIIPPQGGTPIRLSLPGDQQTPAWSPDGHYIAVSGTVVAGQGHQEIFTLRPDGTGLRRRTFDLTGGSSVHPAWIRRQ